MNAIKTIATSLLLLLTMTSVGLACAAHEEEYFLDPPTTPRIEEAVIYVNSVESGEESEAPGTLRIFLNRNDIMGDIVSIEVLLTNTEVLPRRIRKTMEIANSGEIILDIDDVADFNIGSWQLTIRAIDSYDSYGDFHVQIAPRIEDAILSGSDTVGCDVSANSGSTTWSALMGFALLGLLASRRRLA